MNSVINPQKQKKLALQISVPFLMICGMLMTSCSSEESILNIESEVKEALNPSICRNITKEERGKVLQELKKVEKSFAKKIPNIKERPYTLYEMQITTANQLLFAELADDLPTLDRLVEFYDLAFPFLEKRNKALFYYGKVNGKEVKEAIYPLTNSARMWTLPPRKLELGAENVLISSQFLYATTRLSRVLAERLRPDVANPLEAKEAKRYRAFIDRWLPIAGVDHLHRWMNRSSKNGPASFQVRGWGCARGTYTHPEMVDHLLHRRFGTAELGMISNRSYCNVITDWDLFIAGIGAELVAAVDDLGGSHPQIPASTLNDIRIHTRNLSKLFAARHSERSININGKSMKVAVFDRGSFDDHPDYAYSAYIKNGPHCSKCISDSKECNQCAEFPGWKKKGEKPEVKPQSAKGIGWDLSHARRIPIILDSLRRYQVNFNGTFPTLDQTKQYARQLAYVTFVDNEDQPRFANYFDGSNGWYRVNYSKRPNFGYAPESFSLKMSTFGYSFWDEPRLQKLLSNVRRTTPSSELREYEKAAQFIESLGLSFSAPRCEQREVSQ